MPGFNQLTFSLRFWIFIWAFSLSSLTVYGQVPGLDLNQQAEKSPTPKTEDKKEPQPFLVTEIPYASMKLSLFLREIKNKFLIEEQRTKIKNEVDSLISNSESFRQGLSKQDVDILKIRQLGLIRRDMRAYLNRLEQLQTNLDSKLNQLDKSLNELFARQRRWELTRDTLRTKDWPRDLVDKVNESVREIEALEKPIANEFGFIFNQLSVISDELLQLDEQIDILNVKILEAQESVFSINSPPIWELIRNYKQDSLRLTTSLTVLKQRQLTVESYFSDHLQGLILVGVLLVALMLLITLLNKKLKSWTSTLDPNILDDADLIMDKPIPLALLFGLLIVTYTVFDAPLIIVEIISVMIVFPVLSLVRIVSPPVRRLLFYVFVVIYVLTRAYNLGILDDSTSRLILLFLTTATGVVFAELIRPNTQFYKSYREGKLTFIYPTMVLATVGIWLATGANILGAYLLADLVGAGIIRSVKAMMILIISFYATLSFFNALFLTPFARKSQVLQNHGQFIKRRFKFLLRALFTFLWLAHVTTIFHLDVFVKNLFSEFLSSTLTLGDLNITVSSILAFVLTIWLSMVISKNLRVLLEEDVFPRMNLQDGLPGAISMIVRYSLIAIGFFLAIAAAGIPLDRVAIILGAFSVGIGFGLQNIFNNLVSGIILAFERPIKAGDIIEVGTLLGEVKTIGFRSSRVRTYLGSEVIVPNGNLISSEVTNWTLSDRLRRLETGVGVAYGTDVKKVLEILREAVKAHPEVLSTPEPIVLFDGFGDSSLDFRVLFWTANFDSFLRIRSEVTVALSDAINNAGIEIPFPQRDLHLRSVDEKAYRSMRPNGRDSASPKKDTHPEESKPEPTEEEKE